MNAIEKHLSLLGFKAKDKVTGFEGIITSIAFDLYGCIQAILNSEMNKDGKLGDQYWFDISRLQIKSKKSVISQPNFTQGYQAEGKQGFAEKPIFNKI